MRPCEQGLGESAKARPSAAGLHELAQHVMQDTAVLEVEHFLRGVDAHDRRKPLFFASIRCCDRDLPGGAVFQAGDGVYLVPGQAGYGEN